VTTNLVSKNVVTRLINIVLYLPGKITMTFRDKTHELYAENNGKYLA
jgi:hypothetical protein